MFKISLSKQLYSLNQSIHQAIEEMIDKRLTVIKFQDEFVTKHELYEMLEMTKLHEVHNVIWSKRFKSNNRTRVIKANRNMRILNVSFETIKAGANEVYFYQHLN